jgi:hypothetical protein
MKCSEENISNRILCPATHANSFSASSPFSFRFFSRFLSLFSRFLLALFAFSISAALVSTTCFLRIMILRFFPARTLFFVPRSWLSSAAAMDLVLSLSDRATLDAGSRTTRHGSAVPGCQRPISYHPKPYSGTDLNERTQAIFLALDSTSSPATATSTYSPLLLPSSPPAAVVK